MAHIKMCDKCGNIFKETEASVQLELTIGGERNPVKDYFGHPQQVSHREYDLCSDCARELINQLDAPKMIEPQSKRL